MSVTRRLLVNSTYVLGDRLPFTILNSISDNVFNIISRWADLSSKQSNVYRFNEMETYILVFLSHSLSSPVHVTLKLNFKVILNSSISVP
jgi:hypothetical protein